MGINIALAGNPNCGKTTLFNDLTGANQYTGNWPGVTVERKAGKYKRDKDISIIDLPGVYSLSPYTPEEIVTRDYLLSGDADVVVNIVDATNLERNLYLSTQIMDLGLPVVIALNMMDLVTKNGDDIDVAKLSRDLGCAVVETSALKGKGTQDVIEAAVNAAADASPLSKLRFSNDVERAVENVASIVKECDPQIPSREIRWLAVKALEDESMSVDALALSESARAEISSIRETLEEAQDDDIESIITNERYDLITEICDGCVKRGTQGLTTTQKIDRVVTNRILGIPIFIVIMTLVYYLSISTVGTMATDWVNDNLFGDGWLITNTEQYDGDVAAWEETLAAATEANASDMELAAIQAAEPDASTYGLFMPSIPSAVSEWLESVDCASWLQSLIVDGIIGGVSAVLGFIPQLIVLFLLLGILEGCGYMARVAFIMDRIFRRFGLSGKSFIPMLIASGCGVPAVMATKTIENEKDRRMTVMTTTMIPCGAKLPIIALVFGALAGGFYEGTWWVAPLFYFLGLVAIIVSCIMLKKLRAFAGDAAPFIMELPQYHLPTVKNVLLSTWERIKAYIVKAGTIIFLSSIVIWFLLNFGVYEGQFGMLDTEIDGYLEHSLMAGIGSVVAWIFMPLGFGNWEGAVTTMTGLVAKENVVATVGIITSLGDATEGDPNMWLGFAQMMGGSTAAILAFCAFNLLCAPCFAAMGAIRNQMCSAKWTWAAIGYMCGFAWVVALMFYQIGGLIMGEVAFNFWTVVAIVLLGLMLFQLFRPMPDYNSKENAKAQTRLNLENGIA